MMSEGAQKFAAEVNVDNREIFAEWWSPENGILYKFHKKVPSEPRAGKGNVTSISIDPDAPENYTMNID